MTKINETGFSSNQQKGHVAEGTSLNIRRRLMVATDGSLCSQKALEFLSFLYAQTPDVEYNLATSLVPLPSYLQQGASSLKAEYDRLDKIEEFEKKRVEEANSILGAARRLLEKAGVPKESIHDKALLSVQSIAKGLVAEAYSRNVDALVMGRRGLGQVAAYLLGSISEAVVSQIKGIPIWLAGEPVMSRKILVTMDLCDNCHKVVDTAAFLFSGISGLEITLFHVTPKFRPFLAPEKSASADEMDKVFQKENEVLIKDGFRHCADIITQAGVKGHLECKVKYGSASIAGEIMDEFEAGGYSTLVCGRRGVGGWDMLFPGTVSSRLLKLCQKGSLLLVT